MADGLNKQALRLKPLRRPAMQYRYSSLADPLLQQSPQQLTKKMMITIPAAFVVEGGDEEVGLLKIL
ncbi:MAG: hypothetical protein HC875_38325 [Anaerolineales bacterium]|nr:hypothetical protein [Anaerolineales bacterium]